jgi:hypothetical protein
VGIEIALADHTYFTTDGHIPEDRDEGSAKP